MKIQFEHAWDISITQAQELQYKLAHQVICTDSFSNIQLVAGVDVAYSKETDELIAAVVVLESATLKVIESVTIKEKATFPYIPGLFSFRELPPLLKALESIKTRPDLIICDGQGYAHPRRFGLACHLGIIFNIPTIGCGKTKLLGEYCSVGNLRGDHTPLLHDNEVIGNVLRTQNNVKPVFVSIGHKISLKSACEWVLKLAPKYRLPETTRQADQLVNTVLKTQ
ncbi:deoxyribonuclease V [Catenovulum sediminis]|uniref:deoxyribonuclease V n=1 Tax=Catenovulum sediminis TaxID=1740262 RepID=UPI0011809FB6|nr:deoxyribonuclease V [Catenovulum sediminis]